ncbi:MAG: putative phage abortive infection protein [Bacteroidetes bacterium]|nr:putative phage abortive infection protein [Bacteroidota bacterium]
MKTSKEKKSKLEITGYIVTSFGILLFVWFVCRAWYDQYIIWNNPISLDNAAKIGDFVGGFVGVIFTIVGVFLLFATLTLQRKESIESRKAYRKQQLENSLFNLLSSQREILMNINYTNQDGRKFFTFIKSELKKMYDLIKSIDLDKMFPMQEEIINSLLTTDYAVKRHKYEESLFGDKVTKISAFKDIFKKIDKKDERKILTETYWIIFFKYHNYYGHYFRHLYHILKLIANEQANELGKGIIENKPEYQNYADLVQATLSSDELLVLFFNGLCFKNMKKYLHQFDFLENLPIEDLFNTNHVKIYDEETIDGIKYPKIIFKSMDNSIS